MTTLQPIPNKKILLLVADAGFGHRSAANAIKAALEEQFSNQCEVSIVNPLEDRRTLPLLRESQLDYDHLVRELPALYKFGFETSDSPIPIALVESALTILLFEVLVDIINSAHPDVIVSTFPLYQAPLAAISKIFRYDIPRITVITDLVSIHGIWFNRDVHHYALPNTFVSELASQNGIPAEKVTITGIPVHPDIVNEKRNKGEIRSALGWSLDLPTFLAVGSPRVVQMGQIIRVFNHLGHQIQLVVIAGHNQGLFEEMKAIDWHTPVHIYEYTDNMPVFLRAVDGILCKAGGLIVTEALAAGLPMMLTDVIKGQETGNAEYVVSYGAGDIVGDSLSALETLHHWLMDGGKIMGERAQNARLLGNPRAAYAVANLVWEHALIGPKDERSRHILGRSSLVSLLQKHDIPWQGYFLPPKKRSDK